MAAKKKSFVDIKETCLKNGTLWEDPDFPAIDCSIHYSRPVPNTVEWKRPKEFVEKPIMFSTGASRLDIVQGFLGDDWVLSPMSCLANYPSLLYKVIPPNQDMYGSDYAGVFHFNIWQFGEWVEVLVDDRLPTIEGEVVFVHSEKHTEFWAALLEKAYAKLNGSYEALKAGLAVEAMEDFTGGVPEIFDMKDSVPDNLFTLMIRAFRRKSIMACSIEKSENVGVKEKLDNGLITGHTFAITGVQRVQVGSDQAELVRIRNPWGSKREWTGAWSDGSDEWKRLSDWQKKEMNLVFEHDGEFWMSFADFSGEFDSLYVCNLTPESLNESDTSFNYFAHRGRWRRGATAGGSQQYPNTFHRNPQYCLEATEPDEENDGLCSVVVALMQCNMRKRRKLGQKNNTIGYTLYKLDGKFHKIDKKYVQTHEAFCQSQKFSDSREIAGRHELPPGVYVIIPSTVHMDRQGEFLLRVYSEKPIKQSDLSLVCFLTERITSRGPQRSVSQEESRVAAMSFHEMFEKLAGSDEEVDAYELQEMMTKRLKDFLPGRDFSLDVCRSLVGFYDYDASGKLGYQQFRDCMIKMEEWCTLFKQYDGDNAGTLNPWEMEGILNDIGFSLSDSALQSVSARYGNRIGRIEVDAFIMCVIGLTSLGDLFDEKCGGSDKGTFTLDELVKRSVYH